MNRKQIEHDIGNVICDWVFGLPDSIPKTVFDDYIVTGGCITSLLLGETPKDYDIYFKSTASAYIIAKHYTETDYPEVRVETEEDRVTLKSKPPLHVLVDNAEVKQFKKTQPLTVSFLSENAITLNDKVQLILRFTGSPREIHKNFDFVHATNYYTRDTGLVLNQEALTATINKELVYIGSKYPVCALFRVHKFLSRGWKISYGELLKISYDISQLDLSDPDVLHEQVGGLYGKRIGKVFANRLKKIILDPEIKTKRELLFSIIDRLYHPTMTPGVYS